MKYLTSLFLLIVTTTTFGAEKLNCTKFTTTPDVNACLWKQLKILEKTLEKYYLASIKQNNKKTGKYIQESQKAWIIYRKKHCSAIYEMWIEGTIRGTMHVDCMQKLTRNRTYTLWDAYLTYMDTTPPILPKPKR